MALVYQVRQWQLGEQEVRSAWRAWSSRLVMATLKVIHRKRYLYKALCLFLLCTYLYCQYRDRLKLLFATLQTAISSLPQRDCFMLLGDLMLESGLDKMMVMNWWYEKGPVDMGY